ncbi:proton-coupled amino acid transporter-like protein pathetic isoform X2 [Pararge aegeria]|uniref:proton-coupled amino acid transporter-like protein pathetic isoform X2 n=1 Tax=Pararge aegeria TaxID=116150 RepID=UPI0019D087B8|nr:proton-coupled amino acid transporter-like protein pathetic isoform X2 [Pararge aegeria]
MSAQPSGGGRGNWKNFATTQAEEDAYDYVKFRVNPKPTGFVGSVAHVIKGALGGGILGGHVAFMKAGLIATPFVFMFGMYMTYCLYILVRSAQVLFKRTRVSSMSYPDVGEAAMACFPNPSVAKWATAFRYSIDAIICIDLFGACACYQLIIAKSIKQLVENTQKPTVEGLGPGYPDLRVYLAAMIIPMILICLITHLKWLAPFSLAANGVVCMSFNVSAVFLVSFFGYVGYLQACESPITVNFPMTVVPKILKGLIAMMIYVTHALNFWVPFNLVFFYLKSLHRKEDELKWELIYRAIIVTLIGVIAIVFPNINALMGFLGAFCLSNMAFIWPNMIYLMVVWQRPGLGKYRWRLWKAVTLIGIGIFIFICGSVVSINELASMFK